MSGPDVTAGLPVELPAVSANGRLFVAFSGGLDSTVLLHWLSRHMPERLHAVHVHHGLQPAAGEWAGHCRAVCRQWSLPLEVLEIEVRDIRGMGLEAAARRARYAALAGVLKADDVLVTAHHRGDQAETLLLQLLRGSGPHGLAAMPPCASLGAGQLQRPLLALSRERLLTYARAHELSWIEDPSNADTGLRRNFLRHDVLPVLHAHWPEYERSLQRSAGLQAEAALLLDDLAGQDLAACRGGLQDALSLRGLLRLAPPRRRNLIRFWLRGQALPVPDRSQMERIEADMLAARQDANPLVTWADVELRRYRDDLLAMPLLPPPPSASQTLAWDMQQPLQLPPGCGQLLAERAQGAGLRLENAQLEVRFNQDGERIRPVFSRHHKRLKHLYQEAGVPPWVRERLPLIYHGRRLAAVADVWMAADYAAGPEEQGWQLHWRGAPAGWSVAGVRTDSGKE